MTTTHKIHYGAEVAIFPCDGGFTFWKAGVFLFEVAKDENGKWRKVMNTAAQAVCFGIHGSDYRWHEEGAQRLGFFLSGEWQLYTRFESHLAPETAIEAGKLAIRFRKREWDLAANYGAPTDVEGRLKRALQAIRPAAVRFASVYQEDGSDAEKHWQTFDRKAVRWLDSLIRNEMRGFRLRLEKHRPSLFPKPAEAAAS